MKFVIRKYSSEDDYRLMMALLRDAMTLNGGLERSWSPPRLDYWRWHFIATCEAVPLEEGATLWESSDGQLAAFLHPVFMGEAFVHIHPRFRCAELEDFIFAYAEENLSSINSDGICALYTQVDEDDVLRIGIVWSRGYNPRDVPIIHWYRDLDEALPEVRIPQGYTIRAMGAELEYNARAWASWRAFHPDEGEVGFDGGDWYANLRSAPLYQQDLDIVAVAHNGEIGAFCTIFYDDVSNYGVCVLVGTAYEHQWKGLGKAVIMEGLKRLQALGCTRLFANGYDQTANALYKSVLGSGYRADSWYKKINF